jgi:hypothetical protein
MQTQFHREFKFGIFIFNFYKLGNKWCLRFEISQGWD